MGRRANRRPLPPWNLTLDRPTVLFPEGGILNHVRDSFRFKVESWTSPRMVDTQLRVYTHPWRSINGENTTHLHPGVQGSGRPACHRARLLRRRGRTLPRHLRE